MLLSVTFSKPVSDIQSVLERDYKKIKFKINSSSTGQSYYGEFFTQTQVFHKTFSEKELNDFIDTHAGTTFKSCTERFTDKEVTILSNKKGKITKLEKPVSLNAEQNSGAKTNSANLKSSSKYFSLAEGETQTHNRIKNYIIPEGKPVPFLISLGVMTPEGKIIQSKYDKYRQINRFLEYINDILPSVMELKKSENYPLQIADFGCGKSYLTFAVHYFLTQIKKIDSRIVGLDLKKDVIEHCNDLSKKFGCENLIFKTGDIAEYSDEEKTHNPDIVITLHACDTATDFALKYAVSKNTKAILSVPCCQHEINRQLESNKASLFSDKKSAPLSPLLKYGLLRERFASLVTDSLRAEFLESNGYKVDVMEFIDMSHTPKNILLRAVKKKGAKIYSAQKNELTDLLKIEPEIYKE